MVLKVDNLVIPLNPEAKKFAIFLQDSDFRPGGDDNMPGSRIDIAGITGAINMFPGTAELILGV